MYNYDRSLDYYNYNNNNYNKPLFTEDANPSKMYDPYAGLIHGNMFPSLYNGYKLEQPLEIQPMNERAQMLTFLDALSFAMVDINLYLDLFPNDRDMIQLFQQYRSETDKLRNEYEQKYGPILVDSNASNAFPWAWDENPWPWENM